MGLFAACALLQAGFKVSVFEARNKPLPHSRAIGIHPPALELMASLGLAEALLQEGVKIHRGHAHVGQKRVGTLDFSACPGPYPFILSLPQARTEALLEGQLGALAPHALQRGVKIIGLEQQERVYLTSAAGETFVTDFALIAEGKGSPLRAALNIPFVGSRYPDVYLMGDFADETGLEEDAALFFTPQGLVESFPLPGKMRRWVAKLARRAGQEDVQAAALTDIIWRRTGYLVRPEGNRMLSAFGIERYLAKDLLRGQVALIGDSAHVLSPIGGQGMNLGWLGAWDAVHALAQEGSLAPYALHRRRALEASRRASFNTLMGRASVFNPLRNLALLGILHTPAKRVFARRFTMRGL